MGEIDWKAVLALVVMLAGMAGTVLPVVPGIPMIFLAMFGYDWANDFQILGMYFLGLMLALTVLSLVADYLAGVFGAQKYGASIWGKIGVVVGGIVGFVFFPPIGIFLGPLVGVILGELLAGKKAQEAVLSGWGTFLGILAGVVARLTIACIMVVAFLFRVF